MRGARPRLTTCLAGILICAWTAPSALALEAVPLTDEVAPEVSGAGIVNGSPSVAMNANGDYVVAWRHNDSRGDEIRVRSYRADGTARSGVVTVAASTSNLTAPAVAIDATGDFVVGWTLSSSREKAGFIRRYTASAAPAKAAFRLSASGEPDAILGDSGLGMDANGNYTAAYVHAELPCPRLRVRRFTPVGGTTPDTASSIREIGSGFACLYDFDPSLYLPSVAVASDGKTVVGWTERYNDVTPSGTQFTKLFFQRLAPTGTPDGLGRPTTIEQAQYLPYGGLGGVDISDAGEIVATYRDSVLDEPPDPRPGDARLWVRRYDTANALVETQRADAGSEVEADDPRIAIADDGRAWVAAWADSPGRDGSGTSVRARTFAPGRRGDVTQVNVATSGDQDEPSVAMGPGGETAIAFQSSVVSRIGVPGFSFTASATATLVRRFAVDAPPRRAWVPESSAGAALIATEGAEVRSGAVPLEVECPAQRGPTCSLDISATVPTAQARASAVGAGSRSYRVRSGRVTTVRLPLSRPATAALKRRGKLTMSLAVRTTTRSGVRVRRGKLTVYAPQTEVRASRTGFVGLRVSRGGWAANEKATVTLAGTRREASGTFTTRAGAVLTKRVRLSAGVRTQLSRGRSVKLTLTVTAPRRSFAEASLADPNPRVLLRRTIRVSPPR